MIQYACCNPIDSPSEAHNLGNTAPPAIPTINNAEAVYVNFPNPFIASGQMAGHTNALASPNIAMKKTEVVPDVKMAPRENRMPSIADSIKAICWEIYFGMVKMPIR